MSETTMPEPAAAARGTGPRALVAATLVDDTVTVRWNDGAESAFHHVWLRDHCPSGLHPSTRERLWDWGAFDPEIGARMARLDADGQLEILWPDGHVSRFGADYLHRRRYDDDARAARITALDLWSATAIRSRLPEVDYAAVMSDDGALLDYHLRVRDTGFVIIRNVPIRDWACIEVARRTAFVRETNFGTGFEVISRPNPNNQAYTADALMAHTDLANREMPPGVQFLHCLEFEASGGDSLLVDGFHAAEQLRAADPGAWDLLTRVGLPFRFHDADWDVRWKGTAIALDADGQYHEIRYNPGLGAPLDVPADRVKAVYRALHALSARLKDPANVFGFKLRAGDMMVFNNRRVLHGRAAFDPNTGPRKLQGCYVDLDEWHSRIRVLTGEHLQN